MEISFQGSYDTLEAKGFSFTITYIDDQHTYSKHNVRIFKKQNDVEIDDFFENSHVLLTYLIQRNFTVGNEYNRIVFNRETKQMEEYDMLLHSGDLKMLTSSKEEMKQFYQRFYSKCLKDETIQTLKELYNEGSIKIVERKATK